jgi:hypothetical protein
MGEAVRVNVDRWLQSRGIDEVTKFIGHHVDAGILEYAIHHLEVEIPNRFCQATFHMTFPEIVANNIRRGKLSNSKPDDAESGNENRLGMPVVFTAKDAGFCLHRKTGYFYASDVLGDNLYHTFMFQTLVPLEEDIPKKSRTAAERAFREENVILNRLGP